MAFKELYHTDLFKLPLLQAHRYSAVIEGLESPYDRYLQSYQKISVRLCLIAKLLRGAKPWQSRWHHGRLATLGAQLQLSPKRRPHLPFLLSINDMLLTHQFDQRPCTFPARCFR